MRKSLWIFPVLLLFAALFSTTARADTIITNAGGSVTAIDGITIAGATYNVTFGVTEDTTFNAISTTSAQGIANQLNTDLGSLDINSPLGVFYAFEFGGGQAMGSANGPPWNLNPPTVFSDIQWNTFVGENATVVLQTYWAEFAPVATPEPDTATLTLSGFGLLGLALVMRKRIARGLPQAT
jgi:hypothetical protein